MTSVIYYFFFFQKNALRNTETPKKESIGCLDENRDISYKSENKENVLADLTIFVNNKSTGEEVFSFKINKKVFYKLSFLLPFLNSCL